MFKLRFMVSEILENTQLFLTDPRNSSGGRQIFIYYIIFHSCHLQASVVMYSVLFE